MPPTSPGGSRVRLVKGAYAEPAAVAYTAKAEVDEAYVRCLRILHGGPGYPMVGHPRPAHDRGRPCHGRRARPQRRRPTSTRCSTASGAPSRTASPRAGDRMRVYLPYGADWYGYFIRRLAETPGQSRASSSDPCFPADSRLGALSMDAVTTGPDAGQRAGPHLRPRQRPSVPRWRPGSRSWRRARRADQTIGGDAGWAAASASRRRAAPARLVLGTSATPPTRTWPRRRRCQLGRRPAWRALPFDERAAVILRAAELLAGPWRDTIAAATMLGQSKTVQQAEIDAACELVDFRRFNVHYARQVLAEQPRSAPGVWNRMDHRPLEGFVYAITPFNFTAIAGNLPTAPALMGNTVVWKPSPTQQLAAHHTMRLLEEAGLPAGVINMVTGDGLAVSARRPRPTRDLAGIHFTGSIGDLQAPVADGRRTNIERYRCYPRLVGETGGKDFVVAHPSRRSRAVLTTALVRGAFEYQGQKCSAASRAYVPRSIWQSGLRDELGRRHRSTALRRRHRPANFGGAVIDARAFDQPRRALDRAKAGAVTGDPRRRRHRRQRGLLRRPDRAGRTDPADEAFTTEYFGPILAVHVYDDSEYAASSTSSTDQPVRADRGRLRDGPGRGRAGPPGPAARRGQLLHQRPAHRRRSSPASPSAAAGRRARTTRPARC